MRPILPRPWVLGLLLVGLILLVLALLAASHSLATLQRLAYEDPSDRRLAQARLDTLHATVAGGAGGLLLLAGLLSTRWPFSPRRQTAPVPPAA